MVKENDEIALNMSEDCVNTPLLVYLLVSPGLSACRSPGHSGLACLTANSLDKWSTRSCEGICCLYSPSFLFCPYSASL